MKGPEQSNPQTESRLVLPRDWGVLGEGMGVTTNGCKVSFGVIKMFLNGGDGGTSL